MKCPILALTIALTGCVKDSDIRMDYLNLLKEDGHIGKVIVKKDYFVVEMK